ncbi:hypothetical protein PV416_09305 [Streptomyces ipomoeae]|uniref:Peptide chain release factor 1 n=1 Tax=Streptomyces ipomoeae 91-03 TaxID=698759 RepID=L1KXR2_9ACTN|nr:hypothetical protein [Streptomyces ipomoeae]EKX65265.1 hypothetical protein STRIP9103_09215 [Streptomyces ipomoeae 91-03]MDX2694165.1 hypothetical protein [Streptomyces ipomoeae]MDX2821279.1 hypothetical protein [Streptomyces ipomoeae]MDX2840093.1 hypothetical protein [Streptomyces ipomoeae]MDX2873827.1 hypothetical protein [Streptomyces ipomoeae]
MKLSFLQPLTDEPGPWASVCLDTSRDVDDPDKAIGLRWRHQRETLRAQGADPATVSALEDVAGADRDLPGRHGQALFATHGHVALAEELPDPPVRDTARFGRLPDAMVLARQHAPDIPYVSVALTRDDPLLTAGEENGQSPTDQVLIAYEAGRWPMSRVAPGRRTTHLVQVGEWQHAARRFAQELADLADRHRAEAVVLRRDAGEPWLSGVLVNRLPMHLQNSLTVVEDDQGTDVGGSQGRALIEERVAGVLDGLLSKADERHLDVFLAQRARHRAKSQGARAVVTALQRRQAQAVLLSPPTRLPERLWTGTQPSEIAFSAQELVAFGASTVLEEPADTALLHATLRTGADLVVLPPDETPLADGVGVVLRYHDVEDLAAL